MLAVDGSARDLIVPFNDDEERNPRISAIDWSLDGRAIYATWSERDRWDRGIVRIDLASKTVTPLAKDARLYGNVRLSRDGTRFVYTISENDRPADLYAADASFAQAVRLSDVNAWLAARSLPKSELVGYRDADGRQLYGVLRYPIGYEKGRTYPVVFEIYETFFDNSFNGRAAFLTNHGYAVFHPSVNLVVGRPGDAWVKGVTSAANKLIELGIAGHFAGEPERWFAVEDPVKHVTAQIRTRVREAARKLPAIELFGKIPELVHELVTAERGNPSFGDCGVVIDSIEVQNVSLADGKPAAAFTEAHKNEVARVLEDRQAERRLISVKLRDAVDAEEHTIQREANRRMAEMLGCTLQEIRAKTFFDFCFFEDSVQARERIAGHGVERPDPVEFRFRRMDGTSLLVQGEIRSLQAGANRPAATVMVFADMSAGKQAEERLRESRERLQYALDSADMVAWDWTPESDALIQSTNASRVCARSSRSRSRAGRSSARRCT